MHKNYYFHSPSYLARHNYNNNIYAAALKGKARMITPAATNDEKLAPKKHP
jgi:hypothetical protein